MRGGLQRSVEDSVWCGAVSEAAANTGSRNQLEVLAMNIFVGNLAREVTEEDLKAQFVTFGTVSSVAMIMDKHSGQPRGFAFVEMPDSEEASAAIAGLKGKQLKERTLDISEAQPRSGKSGGGRGGFGGKRKPQRRR
jgi:RNA recognition motif-containing protein